MKISMIASVIWILLFSQSCKVEELKKPSFDPPRGVEPLAMNGISKEEAVAVANKAALKVHKSLSAFNVVVCEQSVFWVVIYDGDGSEYLIDKTSGRIIQVRKVPQGLAEGNRQETGPPKRVDGITEQEATMIARDDFRRAYGQTADNNLTVIPCELAKAWRIVFDVKLTRNSDDDEPVIPDAHAPTYIIDKQTRGVLYRQLY